MTTNYRLSGIIPPLATPLVDDETLDHDALERLIEHVISGGVSGLFVLGTTGEGPCLSRRLRFELVEKACELVGGRVPVLVGVSDTSLDEAVELAHWSADCGAFAVVAAPPYYLPLEQVEIAQWFLRLANESPLPLMLYNIPPCTKVGIELETVEACLDEPNIIGVKDSSGDLPFFQQLLDLRRRRSDWSILIGPEGLLGRATAMGGDGGVCGGANLAPRLFVRWFESVKEGDTQTATQLESLVERLSGVYHQQPRFSAIICGLKQALSVAGLCRPIATHPLEDLPADAKRNIEAIVTELETALQETNLMSQKYEGAEAAS